MCKSVLLYCMDDIPLSDCSTICIITELLHTINKLSQNQLHKRLVFCQLVRFISTCKQNTLKWGSLAFWLIRINKTSFPWTFASEWATEKIFSIVSIHCWWNPEGQTLGYRSQLILQTLKEFFETNRILTKMWKIVTVPEDYKHMSKRLT